MASTSSSPPSWDEEVESGLQALQDAARRVVKAIHAQRQTLDDEWHKLEEERKRAAAAHGQIPAPGQAEARIKLDVGGRQFETTVQTLTSEPGSMLEAMFSGRFPIIREDDATVFLDRDPTCFSTILDYLRDRGKNAELTASFCDLHTITGRERLRLLREVAFYGIDGLRQILEQPTLVVSQDRRGLEALNGDGDGAPRTFFTTIRDAILAAEKGHRIVILPGVYNESLTVDKSITLCGYPGGTEQVVIRSAENVVVSSGANAVLRNLTLRQLGGKFNGILVHEGMLTVEHCDVSSAGLGCFAIRSAHAVLRHNRIHDSPQGGLVFCEGAEGLVEDNQIFGNGLQGIEIREGSKPIITRNRIYNSDQNGILIHSKGRGELRGNEICHNKIDGVMIISEASPSCIENNHIHHNRQRGVFVSRDSNAEGFTVEANTVQHNAINVLHEQ